MWTNVCCSKYSHVRVTNFKTHMRHNNHFSKLIYKETHLPEHMRLKFAGRLIRFLFYPLTILAAIMYLNSYPEFKDIDELCNNRHICHAYCISDNFPDNNCKEV